MKHFTSTIITFAALSSSALAADIFKPINDSNSVYYAPFNHIHASENGTPYVHSFGIEPAFTGRDLFIDQTYVSGKGFVEHETEIEIEWAFTKRFGIIAELPYIYEDEENVASAKGFGDLAIVPRALLIESERFLLTAQIEIVLPTGSSSFGGDTAIAPGIAMWSDLGNNYTLNSTIAIEHGFDSNESELLYGLGFVKSFGDLNGDHSASSCKHHFHHHHSTKGMLHLHLELTGSTPVNGADQGMVNLEALAGISYGLSERLDVRAGYFMPITSPNDFNHGITAGLIFHF